MATYHTKVHVHTIKNEMFNRTMAFTLPNGVLAKDILGRALTVDATIPCGMKLAGEGDPVVARIDVIEHRGPGAACVVTAQFRFSELIRVKDADTVAQGDTVVGAAGGMVKKAGANDPLINFVAELITLSDGIKYASVVKL